MGSLEGAVVVVTGAARGIGHAIAEELGLAGAKVVVNYVKSKEAAEELVTRLQQSGTAASTRSKPRCPISCNRKAAR